MMMSKQAWYTALSPFGRPRSSRCYIFALTAHIVLDICFPFFFAFLLFSFPDYFHHPVKCRHVHFPTLRPNDINHIYVTQIPIQTKENK